VNFGGKIVAAAVFPAAAFAFVVVVVCPEE
jgi:hypothetical protein